MGYIKTIQAYAGGNSKYGVSVDIYTDIDNNYSDSQAKVTITCYGYLADGQYVQSSGVTCYSSCNGKAQGSTSIIGNTNGGTKHYSSENPYTVTHTYYIDKTNSSQSIDWAIDIHNTSDMSHVSKAGDASGTLTVSALPIYDYQQTVSVRYQQADGSWGDYQTVINSSYTVGDTVSWSRDADVIYKEVNISYTVSGENTKYVDIHRNEYPIYFDTNGGVFTPSPQYYIYEGTTRLQKYRPTRSGYKFLGWDLNPNATTPTYSHRDDFTFDNSEPTLYAIWKPNKQNVYIYSSGNCYANEYIEDNVVSISENGEICLTSFTELAIQKDGEIVDLEFIEGNPLSLINENSESLVDENGNYLMYIE